ncbi:glycosyltransferase family 2 protein [Candidatus Saccharibacteria bacterium]|nr:glycosyltransferase family 2 protein [Candidatus Saccharibacteria bacterium]
MLCLSIIIPVYNVEDYLSECLDSILLEAYNSLEIILVDNNSTDNSLKICENYAKKHKNIRVFSCKKWGAAAVRNFGVKKAKGRYLWFVDSDDYIERGAIKKLVDTAEEHDSDAVVMSVRRIYEDGHENILTAVNTNEKDWKKRYLMYGFPPFQNLYRKTFWEKYMNFPEGMIHEDMAILSTAILYTEKISFVEDTLYNYRQRQNSVLHQDGWNPHSLDIFKALDVLLEKFKNSGKFDEYYSEIEYFFIWNLLIDSAKDFHGHTAGKEGEKRTRDMMKNLFPNWRNNKYLKKKPLKFRINCLRGYFGLLK